MSVPTEHAEQATLVGWFDRTHPQLAGRLFAIPNGAHLAGNNAQRAKQMHKLKAEGLRVAVPDMMLPVMRGGYGGLFIEMKRTKWGTVSKEQKKWREFLIEQGYRAEICKGFQSAKEVIECYLNSTTPTTKNG